jgi:hypothetical protein
MNLSLSLSPSLNHTHTHTLSLSLSLPSYDVICSDILAVLGCIVGGGAWHLLTATAVQTVDIVNAGTAQVMMPFSVAARKICPCILSVAVSHDMSMYLISVHCDCVPALCTYVYISLCRLYHFSSQCTVHIYCLDSTLAMPPSCCTISMYLYSTLTMPPSCCTISIYLHSVRCDHVSARFIFHVPSQYTL